MKKSTIYIMEILLFIIIIFVYNYMAHPINSTLDNLEKEINAWLNSTNTVKTKRTINFSNSIQYEDLTYISFAVEDEIGYIILEENNMGRYKINNINISRSDFIYEIVVFDNNQLMLVGRNADAEIAEIEFDLQNNEANFERKLIVDIPEDEIFILTQEIDEHFENTNTECEIVAIYGDFGENIIDTYNLS